MSDDGSIKLIKKDLKALFSGNEKKLHPKPFHGSGQYRESKWVGNRYKTRVQSITVSTFVERPWKNPITNQYEKIKV